MKITLEFKGNETDFEKALTQIDSYFNITDSILWELDYGDGCSHHNTKYGDITIRKEI